MKIHGICAVVFLLWNVTFSQTPFDKCIDECVWTSDDLPSCNITCDSSDTIPIVTVGQGNPLYLFSYELQGPAPVIDGSLMSRDGDPSTSEAMDEWKSACSRTLVLNDSGVVQLFLVNSPDTLYVGITYEHNNNGDGCGVRLLFDEGNNLLPSQYDGSTDMKLGAPGGVCNEQGCSVIKSGGSVALQDLCWNGTAWVSDGDGQVNFRGAKAYFNSDKKVHHNEFAIPLNNKKSDDAANSDLNVNFNDVLGFYLEVIKMGAGAGTWHWKETNGLAARPDTFPSWAKIQLSVKRNYFTFYTGRGSNPPPVINGSIDERVWNGAYQREMVLSNYHYGTLKCKIWCLEDSAQNAIYIGVRVFDRMHNPLDFCQVFFEETGENATSPMRDYDLDNGMENTLKITNANLFTDGNWDMDNSQWVPDAEAADSQDAKAGEAASYTDYEFRVLRSAGANDIDIPKGGLLGFLVRYHDADKTVSDLSNFYWEYTTNNDAQLLDQQGHPYVYIATGWTNLQLGGPFIQVVKPSSGDSLHGMVPVEVSSGADSLKSVICFFSSDTVNKVVLTYQGNGTWTGTIDATSVPAGQETMLIIRVVTVADVTYERMINKVEEISVLPLVSGKAQKTFGARVHFESKQIPCILVNLERPGSFVCAIYAVNGRKLWSNRISNAGAGLYRINFSAGGLSLKNGIYMLMVSRGNDKVAQKFTVVR